MHRGLKIVLGRLGVAKLLVQPRQFDPRVGGSRVPSGPILQQREGAIRTFGLDQQNRQPAMAVGVVFILIETLVVKVFGLSQGLAVVLSRTDPMVGSCQVVVGVRVAGFGQQRLLELLHRGGILALLIQLNARRVVRVREGAAANGDERSEHQQR